MTRSAAIGTADDDRASEAGQRTARPREGRRVHRVVGALALLFTGLLAGAFGYGAVNVVQTFKAVPLDVRLTFHTAMMKMNGPVMQTDDGAGGDQRRAARHPGAQASPPVGRPRQRPGPDLVPGHPIRQRSHQRADQGVGGQLRTTRPRGHPASVGAVQRRTDRGGAVRLRAPADRRLRTGASGERKPAVRIAVFGATGGTGRLLIGQARAAGHQVTAVVRDPARLAGTPHEVTVAQIDVMDPAAVAAAIRGCDVVVSPSARARSALRPRSAATPPPASSRRCGRRR